MKNNLKIINMQVKNLFCRMRYLKNWYSLYLVYFNIKKKAVISFKNSITVKISNKDIKNFFFVEQIYLLKNKDPKINKLLYQIKDVLNTNKKKFIIKYDKFWNIQRDYMLDNLHDVFQKYSEPQTYSCFNKLNGELFVNIGANCGGYAIRCAKFSKVIAIEPNPKIISLLKENKRINKINNLKIINKAVWNKKQRMSLYEAKSYLGIIGGSSTLLPENMSNNIYQKNYYVMADTLDNILRGINKIDLLLIDAENAEVEILNGALQVLKRTRNIIIEVRDNTEEQIKKILIDNKFRLKTLDISEDSKNIYGKNY